MCDTDQLLNRAGKGDSAAVQELLERHRAQLKRMVMLRFDHRVAARVDPSDVVQETLVVAAERLHEYIENHPISFYPWLRQLALDRLIQLHRKHLLAQKRTVVREQSWSRLNDLSRIQLAQCLAGDATSPSQHAQKREQERRLQAAIARLPGADQELLVLRYVEQLSPQDAAEFMGIKPNTFSQRHVRVLKKLRTLMDIPEVEGGS